MVKWQNKVPLTKRAFINFDRDVNFLNDSENQMPFTSENTTVIETADEVSESNMKEVGIIRVVGHLFYMKKEL